MLQNSTAGCPDSIFVILFRAAVMKEQVAEDASCFACVGTVPNSLTFIVLVVADGLFGLCGSGRLGQAIYRYSTTLTAMFWWWWIVSLVFVGWGPWDKIFVGTLPP